MDSVGRIVITVAGCTAVGASGAIKDLHFASSDFSLEGQLSSDNKFVLFSDLAALVSTVTTVETGLDSKRICSRTGTAVRVR